MTKDKKPIVYIRCPYCLGEQEYKGKPIQECKWCDRHFVTKIKSNN